MLLMRSSDLLAAGENFGGFWTPKYRFLLKICSKELKFLPWWENRWTKNHWNFLIYIYTGLYIYRQISILVREFTNLYIYRVIYIPANHCNWSKKLAAGAENFWGILSLLRKKKLVSGGLETRVFFSLKNYHWSGKKSRNYKQVNLTWREPVSWYIKLNR